MTARRYLVDVRVGRQICDDDPGRAEQTADAALGALRRPGVVDVDDRCELLPAPGGHWAEAQLVVEIFAADRADAVAHAQAALLTLLSGTGWRLAGRPAITPG